MFCIFTFESLFEKCKCNITQGFSLISKGIKSLYGFTVIFIYVNVSIFVYKVFFVHYFLCKASPQISKNYPVNDLSRLCSFYQTCLCQRLFWSSYIASIFIFFKSWSDKYKIVLSCLKLKQNRFKLLKQSMFTFTTKVF